MLAVQIKKEIIVIFKAFCSYVDKTVRMEHPMRIEKVCLSSLLTTTLLEVYRSNYRVSQFSYLASIKLAVADAQVAYTIRHSQWISSCFSKDSQLFVFEVSLKKDGSSPPACTSEIVTPSPHHHLWD